MERLLSAVAVTATTFLDQACICGNLSPDSGGLSMAFNFSVDALTMRCGVALVPTLAVADVLAASCELKLAGTVELPMKT